MASKKRPRADWGPGDLVALLTQHVVSPSCIQYRTELAGSTDPDSLKQHQDLLLGFPDSAFTQQSVVHALLVVSEKREG
eukprot:12430701-Alexandrium_andersonii.AAC.1